MMSIQSRRELHSRTWSRYRAAGRAQKSVILDEFVAATGFARKYAIRLLAQPSPAAAEKSTSPQRRRTYGPEVQDALTLAGRRQTGSAASDWSPSCQSWWAPWNGMDLFS